MGLRTCRESVLPDALARQIRALIQNGEVGAGARLPPIQEMARRFRVGAPTLREALKKLEAVGMVEIRHGSRVYVGRTTDVLVLANPQASRALTEKLIGDVIESRIPLELRAAALAAEQASSAHLHELERLLADHAGFHRMVAIASGNAVLVQLLDALRELLTGEGQGLVQAFHDCDRADHLSILDALQQRAAALAVDRMRAHLSALRDTLQGWPLTGSGVRAAS